MITSVQALAMLVIEFLEQNSEKVPCNADSLALSDRLKAGW